MPSYRGRGKKRKLKERDLPQDSNASISGEVSKGKTLRRSQSNITNMPDVENNNIPKFTKESQNFKIQQTNQPCIEDDQKEQAYSQELNVNVNEQNGNEQISENLKTRENDDTDLTNKPEIHACTSFNNSTNKGHVCDNPQNAKLITQKKVENSVSGLLTETKTIAELSYRSQINDSNSSEVLYYKENFQEKNCKFSQAFNQTEMCSVQELQKDKILTDHRFELEDNKEGHMDIILKGPKIEKAENVSQYIGDVSVAERMNHLSCVPGSLQDTVTPSFIDNDKAETSLVSASQKSLLLLDKVSCDLELPNSQRQTEKKFKPSLKSCLTGHEENSDVREFCVSSQAQPDDNDFSSLKNQEAQLSPDDTKIQNLASSELVIDYESMTKKEDKPMIFLKNDSNTFNEVELKRHEQDTKGSKSDEQAALGSPDKNLQPTVEEKSLKNTTIFGTDVNNTVINAGKEQVVQVGSEISDDFVDINEKDITCSEHDKQKDIFCNRENSPDDQRTDMNETDAAPDVNPLQTVKQMSMINPNTNYLSASERDPHIKGTSQWRDIRSCEDEKNKPSAEKNKVTYANPIADAKSGILTQPSDVACNEAIKDLMKENSFSSCSQEFASVCTELDKPKTETGGETNTDIKKIADSEKERLVSEVDSINTSIVKANGGGSAVDSEQNNKSRDIEIMLTHTSDNSKAKKKSINGNDKGNCGSDTDAQSNIRIQDSPNGTQPFSLTIFSPQINILSSEELSHDKPDGNFNSVTDLTNISTLPHFESNSNQHKSCNSNEFEMQYSKKIPTNDLNLSPSIHPKSYDEVEPNPGKICEVTNAQQINSINTRSTCVGISFNYVESADNSGLHDFVRTLPLENIQKTTPAGESAKQIKLLSGEKDEYAEDPAVVAHSKEVLNVPETEKQLTPNKSVSISSSALDENDKSTRIPEQQILYNSLTNLEPVSHKTCIPAEEMIDKPSVVSQREATRKKTTMNFPLSWNALNTSKNSLSDNKELSDAKSDTDGDSISNVTKFFPLQKVADNHNNYNGASTVTSMSTAKGEKSLAILEDAVATEQIMAPEDFQGQSCTFDRSNQSMLRGSDMDISDSQLCKLANEDMFDINDNDTDLGEKFHCGLVAAETKALKEVQKKKTEGKQLVSTIMADLVSINKQLLRMKREMDEARRKVTQQQQQNSRLLSKSKGGFNFGSGT